MRKVLGFLLLAVAAAGCSSEQGQAAPAPGTASTTSEAPATTTTTAARPQTVAYNNEKLCELLTAQEAAQVGSSTPRPGSSWTTGNPQCQWGGENLITLDFGRFDQLKTGAGITNSVATVAGEQVDLQQIEDVNVFCQVIYKVNGGRDSVAVGSSVGSSGRDKGWVPCDVATKLAEIVIPKVKG